MTDNGKRLYRDRDNAWLGGVCAGLGNYFDIDATVIRVLFILFSFVVGGGLLIYGILWIVIPVAPGPDLSAMPDPADEKEPEAEDPFEKEDGAGGFG